MNLDLDKDKNSDLQAEIPKDSATVEKPESSDEKAETETAIKTSAEEIALEASAIETEKLKAEQLKQSLQTLAALKVTQDQLSLKEDQVKALSTLSLMLNTAPAPTPAQLQAADRAALLNDPKSRKERVKQLKEMIKKEKNFQKDMKKIARYEAELANIKKSANYSYQKFLYLEQMNNILDSGEYINQSFAFIQEQPLILDLLEYYPKCSNLSQFTIPYDNKKITVNNEVMIPTTSVAAMKHFQGRTGRSDGYDNALHKLATENTKMSPEQARNMVNTVGLAGLTAGVFFLGKWFFTEKDENDKGKRKFKMSFEKVALLLGIPLAANFASQAATGEGVMNHLTRLRKEGKTPWSKDAITNAPEHQRISIGQNMVQYILLGVPYTVLADCVNAQTGTVTSMDTQKLHAYYTKQLQEADANNDGKNQTIYAMQLKALEEVNSNKDAKNLFDTTVAKMNIDAATLKDPSQATQTLDQKIHDQSERYQAFEQLLNSREYIINPDKSTEINEYLFTKATGKTFTHEDFEKMVKEGLLIPNDKHYQQIDQLAILQQDKLDFHKNFKKMAGKSEYQGLAVEIVDDKNMNIISNGKATTLNFYTRTLPGLKDAAGDDLIFLNNKELIETGLFINALRANDKEIWGVEADLTKKGDANWPFDLAGGVSQVWKGVQSIEFKKHSGGVVVMSNLLPFLSEMDLKFPTIAKGDNRMFFVNYLNNLWVQDHPGK